MRKIERAMQRAICNLSNGQTWRQSNTEVAKNSEGDTSFETGKLNFIGREVNRPAGPRDPDPVN